MDPPGGSFEAMVRGAGSVKGLDEAAAALASMSRARPGPDVVFDTLQATEAARAVAIDGSSAVIADTGAVWVVAHRAQAVSWPGAPTLQPPVEVTAASPDAATELVARRFADNGLERPRIHGAEGMVEALRDLAEMRAAVRAIRDGATFVYVDGALEDLPPGPQAMADRVKEAAGDRCTLVGVAKRSRLASDHGAMLPSLSAAGPAGAWSVSLSARTHVARLHARAEHVFRIDAPAEALPAVAGHARDAVYLGYPYPLALAHNTVCITGDEVARIRAALAERLAAEGAPGALGLLEDFHEVLDRNVP